MADFLKQVQDTLYLISPIVLAATGFVLVWLGLCLWLGGLRWLKVLAGLAGAGVGYAVAAHFLGQQFYYLIGIAVAVGILALFFEKTAVVILSAAIGVLLVNLLLVSSLLAESKTWKDAPKVDISKETPPDLVKSLTILEDYGRYVEQKTWQLVQSQGNVGLTATVIAALAIVGIGLAFPRMICAMGSAVLGVAAIALGMFLLLLYKGSKPVDYIVNQTGLFALITGVMVLFGVMIDLALCPGTAKKKAAAGGKPKGDGL